MGNIEKIKRQIEKDNFIITNVIFYEQIKDDIHFLKKYYDELIDRAMSAKQFHNDEMWILKDDYIDEIINKVKPLYRENEMFDFHTERIKGEILKALKG